MEYKERVKISDGGKIKKNKKLKKIRETKKKSRNML
jgi:hypothetical protein